MYADFLGQFEMKAQESHQHIQINNLCLNSLQRTESQEDESIILMWHADIHDVPYMLSASMEMRGSQTLSAHYDVRKRERFFSKLS